MAEYDGEIRIKTLIENGEASGLASNSKFLSAETHFSNNETKF